MATADISVRSFQTVIVDNQRFMTAGQFGTITSTIPNLSQAPAPRVPSRPPGVYPGSALSQKEWDKILADEREAALKELIAEAEKQIADAKAELAAKQEADEPMIVGGRKVRFLAEENDM